LIPKLWNLIADIGGTNARFGLEDYASSQLQFVRHYSVSEFARFDQALSRFLAEVIEMGDWSASPRAACLAVASPVDGDVIQFTNSAWAINRQDIAVKIRAPVSLINDFAAVGYAVSGLKPKDWHQVGPGTPVEGKPIAIVGPGTGLGVCSLIPVGTGYQVIEGEGGHVDFSPVDEQEAAVLHLLSRRFGRVSVERLLSGAGILNIYQAQAQLANKQPLHDSPAAVTESALNGVETLAVNSLAMFCRVLGGVAGNLALTLGAKGGVYIAGGIVPRIIDFLEQSEFRHRFEAKGRFRDYLGNIPVRVVLQQNLGLMGAIRKLNLSEL